MDFATSWSGGKDSCYAMIKAIRQGLVPKVILNMMNENGKVSRSHGLPLSILQQQAQKMNLSIEAVPATWGNYEEKFIAVLRKLKQEYSIDTVVFGDIDLQPHKDWEDKVCAAAHLQAVLPLWQQDRLSLVNEMLDCGIVTMIVSCNTLMGETYLGQLLTKDLITELHQKGIDPCGENGEFHTVAIDCPIFSEAIVLPTYHKKTYNDYCFIVWED